MVCTRYCTSWPVLLSSCQWVLGRECKCGLEEGNKQEDSSARGHRWGGIIGSACLEVALWIFYFHQLQYLHFLGSVYSAFFSIIVGLCNVILHHILTFLTIRSSWNYSYMGSNRHFANMRHSVPPYRFALCISGFRARNSLQQILTPVRPACSFP